MEEGGSSRLSKIAGSILLLFFVGVVIGAMINGNTGSSLQVHKIPTHRPKAIHQHFFFGKSTSEEEIEQCPEEFYNCFESFVGSSVKMGGKSKWAVLMEAVNKQLVTTKGLENLCSNFKKWQNCIQKTPQCAFQIERSFQAADKHTKGGNRDHMASFFYNFLFSCGPYYKDMKYDYACTQKVSSKGVTPAVQKCYKSIKQDKSACGTYKYTNAHNNCWIDAYDGSGCAKKTIKAMEKTYRDGINAAFPECERYYVEP